MVSALIDRELNNRVATRTPTLRYLTGAFCETLTYWLAQQNAASSSEIEQLLKQYSAPVFARA